MKTNPSEAAVTAAASRTKPFGEVIPINGSPIKDHLNKIADATLNGLLDA